MCQILEPPVGMILEVDRLKARSFQNRSRIYFFGYVLVIHMLMILADLTNLMDMPLKTQHVDTVG